MAPESEDQDDDGRAKGEEDSQITTDDLSSSSEPEEEEDDDEPKLKYATVTGSLGPVYRNGDATSTFLVSGDKMVVATHNGNIHVQSLPTLQSLKIYHAHSASITTISISPFPPPAPNPKADAAAIKSAALQQNSPSTPKSSPNPKSPKQRIVPATASNLIYIATSSIDGNVCVASLTDPKDVQLRSFGRPVQAVALSPNYKNDKIYLSGGLAGNLVMTVGGRAGTSSTSNTTGTTAAVASSWLGSMGIGTNTGKDSILHSGEGTINTIKWSLSGNFVVWINEQGIKIMRSHLHLDSEELDDAWKRISHVDRPDGPGWDDMSAVWKARAEWIDTSGLETDDEIPLDRIQTPRQTRTTKESKSSSSPSRTKPQRVEKLLVGWGGTIWILNVYPGGIGTGKNAGEKSIGRAEIAKLLRTDCIISGLTLYTPSLLLLLAFVEPEQQSEDGRPSQSTPKKGAHHRKNALPPELRLIDLDTTEEVTADSLPISRYESLTTRDYHLGILPSVRNAPTIIRQQGALEYVGGTLWTAGSYATGMITSAGSVLAGSTKSDGSDKIQKTPSITSSLSKVAGTLERVKVPHASLAGPGMKIYIHSPYDCILAVKRDLADHLAWLLDQQQYEESWHLVNDRPEVVDVAFDNGPDSAPSTPSRTKAASDDFFVDDSSSIAESGRNPLFTAAEKEKRRIGELWLRQLIDAKKWTKAGEISGEVLTLSTGWEKWFWVFAEAEKFDEITPYIPTEQLKPPLPTMLYEVVLGHYITFDRLRFRELIETWSPDLFDLKSVTTSLQGKLKSGEFREDTIEDGEQGRDWRILLESLAKLLLADGRPREALRCRIKLKDADAAMDLIQSHHLLDAVADDIPGLIMLRVSDQQMRDASIEELEALTEEPIKLLVHEANYGVVRPETVVTQLEEADRTLFLFFYLRKLWKGQVQGELDKLNDRDAVEDRSVVEEFPDLAVTLFAEYDRPLLMEFLKSSQSYSLESALKICERRNYVQEQVYLLSLTGQTKTALRLIIDKLHDVSGAIAFAKQQDDPDLWNDLLDYSMDKPRFIRGLLEEVGTAIDPIKLVKRIPEGLEIEGLKDGLGRMVREYEIQHSISDGVAKVFRSEVAEALKALRIKQEMGIRFEIEAKVEEDGESGKASKPGRCVGCDGQVAVGERQTLIGFPCGHLFHLNCLLDYEDHPGEIERPTSSEDEPDYPFRSVGNKVTHAMLIKNQISGGCPIDTQR